MGLPVFMLFVLLLRSVTLPGASDGISAYIGTWDWSVLVDKPDVWSTAVSQIFFSLVISVSLTLA
jgi:solute carrier family 6 GABA transporter-like protein 1